MAKVYQTIICGRTFPTATLGRVRIAIYSGARMQNVPADETAPKPPIYTYERSRQEIMVYKEPSGAYLWAAPNSEVIRIFPGDKVRR